MSMPLIRSPDTLRRDRLPPGHRAVQELPVRHAGQVPPIDLATWDLTIFPVPLVDRVHRLSWVDFKALPRVRLLADMHGDGWSRLDNLWDGVPTRALLKLASPNPAAQFVMVHGEYGYTANLPREIFFAEDSLLADTLDGRPLPAEHGGPVRLVIPRLLSWKSVKWVRGIEFMAADRPGFWELPEHGARGNPDPFAQAT